MKNAEASAAVIAQAYGKPLGAVKSVTEASENASYAYSGGAGKNSMMAMESLADRDAGTTISYDKIEITARVSVSYAF